MNWAMAANDPGELLRAVRQRKEISQRELSELAGTTQSAISRLENGARSPTVRQLAKLLDAMGEELRLDSTPKQGRASGGWGNLRRRG